MDWLYWALFFVAAFAALVFAVVRDGGLRTGEAEPARGRRKTPAPIELPKPEPIEAPAVEAAAEPARGEAEESDALADDPEPTVGESEAKPESEGERNT